MCSLAEGSFPQHALFDSFSVASSTTTVECDSGLREVCHAAAERRGGGAEARLVQARTALRRSEATVAALHIELDDIRKSTRTGQLYKQKVAAKRLLPASNPHIHRKPSDSHDAAATGRNVAATQRSAPPLHVNDMEQMPSACMCNYGALSSM